MSTAKIIGVTVAPGVAPPAFVGTGTGVGLHAGTQVGIHAGVQTGVHSTLGTVGHAVTTGLSAAAPFLAGVAVAAGAVMMTRAGMLALADLDARREAETQAWRRVQGDARRWQDAYARLLRCNAHLVQLDATVRRWGPGAGPVPPLPAPLDPYGSGSDPAAVTVEAVERWCDETERALPQVADAVRRARLARARRPLAADCTAVQRAEQAFVNRMESLLAPSSPSSPLAPARPAAQPVTQVPDPVTVAADVRAGVWDGVRQVLEELRDGPLVDGWQDVVACAEQVRTVTELPRLQRARNEFYAVAQQFRQARDERAEQARIAATCLAALDPSAVPPTATHVIARLEAVAAQAAPLEAQLQRDAEVLLARQEQAAEARYTMAALQHALAEQGYDARLDTDRVRPQVSVARGGQAAGRLDWSTEGVVRATFEGGDAVPLSDWARALAGATESAAVDGVTARIRHVEHAPPGVVRPAAADVPEVYSIEDEFEEFEDQPATRYRDHDHRR